MISCRQAATAGDEEWLFCAALFDAQFPSFEDGKQGGVPGQDTKCAL